VGGTVFRADDNEVIPSDLATIDAKAFADEIRKVCRLFAGGKWIRNSSSGASGEADAFLPVKDRPGKGVARRREASVAQSSATADAKRTQ